MSHNSSAFLLLALTLAVLLSLVVAVIAYALARWEGAAMPTALSRSGVAFAAGLTLSLAILSAVGR
ncbi:hypothetical protein [Streptomyces sp. NPDC058964]|uniref:hypothetical protein n=1 Tax=Streptomyces sp. NPDC058964 TaxID=3346681 RepID=UPI0036AFBD2B